MPFFYQSPPFFAPLGLLIFVLQLSIYVFAFPLFHYGTWYQVEPTMQALWVLAAINGLWLAVGFFKRWLIIPRPVHPLLLTLAVWIAWQIGATLLSSSPWRSWFGHPSIGEGAGFYSAMLMSYLLAAALWRERSMQRIMLAVALLYLLVMAWSHFDPSTLCKPTLWDVPAESIAVGNWPEYIVFLVAYLWIAFAACAPSLRTPARYCWGVLIAIAIIANIAQSHSAKVIFYPALAVGGIFLWYDIARRPKWIKPKRFWRGVATVCCLLPVAWIAISQASVWAKYRNCSMPTRALFNQVSLTTIIQEPQRLLIGNGWGGYSDDLFKYALVDGTHVFKEGRRNPNWIVLDGTSHHSHDEVMETLLALGIPGMLMWLALPIIIIWTLPRRLFWWCAPIIAALCAYQAFWFFLPQVLAYQAMFWAALSASRKQPPAGKNAPALVLSSLCLFAGLVMIWSAQAHWQAMSYGERLSKAITQEPKAPYQDFSVAWLSEDIKRGGDRFYSGAKFYGLSMLTKTATQPTDAQDSGWYLRFMQTAHIAAQDPSSGPVLTSLDMWLHNILFSNMNASSLDTLKPAAKETLVSSAYCITDKAPAREDVTALLLYSLPAFTQGDETQQLAILKRILHAAPHHRAALWVLGSELVKTPGREAEGQDMLRRAREQGVERVFPVTRRELRQNP